MKAPCADLVKGGWKFRYYPDSRYVVGEHPLGGKISIAEICWPGRSNFDHVTIGNAFAEVCSQPWTPTIGPSKIGEICMNQSSDSSDGLQPVPTPGEGWIVAWDGIKKVKIHKILNNLEPPRAVIESGGCVFGLEMAADVYPDERNACLAGWLKRMEEAAAAMRKAEAFKKRADELNKGVTS